MYFTVWSAASEREYFRIYCSVRLFVRCGNSACQFVQNALPVHRPNEYHLTGYHILHDYSNDVRHLFRRKLQPCKALCCTVFNCIYLSVCQQKRKHKSEQKVVFILHAVVSVPRCHWYHPKSSSKLCSQIRSQRFFIYCLSLRNPILFV